MIYAFFADEVMKHGLVPARCTEFHWQIRGGSFLINFYPTTNKVYIDGTVKGFKASLKEAIELAKKLPDDLPLDKGKRRRSTKSTKDHLYSKSDKCHWCGKKLAYDELTIDHVIPLSKGGLDNGNNVVGSCKTCNKDKANSMPKQGKCYLT